MSQAPSASGPIPKEGPLSVLLAAERRRTTGVLLFRDAAGQLGELPLTRGEPGPEGVDALDAFLALTDGSYELWQRLPALAVSRGDDAAREGRIGAHTPAGLMRYCETAGLTGALTLSRGERRAGLLYDAGELVAVQMLGQGDESVPEVLAWEDGFFRVEAWTAFPTLPSPSEAPEEPLSAQLGGFEVDSGEQTLLRVIDVALASLVDEPVDLDELLELDPPPPRNRVRRDATVRVIYLGTPRPHEPVAAQAPARASEPSLPPMPPPPAPKIAAPQSVSVPMDAERLSEPHRAAGTLPPAPPPRRRRPRRTDAATVPSAAPPVHAEEPINSPPSGDIPTFRSYVREVGAPSLVVLGMGALLLVAAIAYPFWVG